MTYRVIWSPRAESELAEAWLDAANRREVSNASATIDRILGQQPFQAGNPFLSSVNRFAVVPPLGIGFDTIEDDKKVIVQTCWLVG